MANLSILSSLLTATNVKKLKKVDTKVQEFLQMCDETFGITAHSIDSDYESILQVEHTETGLQLVCNSYIKVSLDLPSNFLSFGLKVDEKIPFYKWYNIFEFCLIDLDNALDFDDLRFSGK